jgi:prevent-host-death family protein
MKSKHRIAEPVSAYDAKTHLPNLIARAEKGERFVITRHGRPVAQIGPIEEFDATAMQNALKAVSTLRKRLHAKGVTLSHVLPEPINERRVSDLTHDGHRY